MSFSASGLTKRFRQCAAELEKGEGTWETIARHDLGASATFKLLSLGKKLDVATPPVLSPMRYPTLKTDLTSPTWTPAVIYPYNSLRKREEKKQAIEKAAELASRVQETLDERRALLLALPQTEAFDGLEAAQQELVLAFQRSEELRQAFVPAADQEKHHSDAAQSDTAHSPARTDATQLDCDIVLDSDLDEELATLDV